MSYKEIDIRTIEESAVRLFSQDWAILTAGTPEAHNSMTVSWGLLGELWAKHVAVAFIRPHRHTFTFAQQSDYFSLSFYDAQYKPELGVFGKKSGRDTNKYEETGINALTDGEWVYTEKAKLVLLCKKMAVQELQPGGFLDPSIESCYPMKDYHKIFVGEIVKTLRAE
ncbi:MAG: flavin reductase [Oscillospiraceae bacterium]|jgi:flavin reductase (DIM6/NTAB) family NADH-FMN oxidoreductase RutF|nr:flavin reductase [Oscillospiraceae bacterium]